MKLENFNYKLKKNKSENCILIKAKEWEDNTSQLIKLCSKSGREGVTYISRVLDENIDKKTYNTQISKGDKVLLTKTASNVAYLAPFKIPVNFDNTEYGNVHVMQIIGKFEGEETTLESLQPLYDKVIMEKVKVEVSDTLEVTTGDELSVGKIVKIGTNRFSNKWEKEPLKTKVGDVVLLRDNITTNITFSSKDYMCTEEGMIVGVFKNEEDLSLDNLEYINNSVLMKEFEKEKIEDNSVIFSPILDINIEDISDIYDRDRFTVVGKDSKISELSKGDNIYMWRDYTNYVYFKGKQYFITYGIKDILGKYI